MARTCEALPNESDAQNSHRPWTGGALWNAPGRQLAGRQCWVCPGCPRDPWHTACAGHHQYTQAWRGPVADSCRPVPPRSSDFGTSYTKLTLQPGVTTVIDNFYICPTNKRKVGAAPAASLGGVEGEGVTLLLWSPEGR